MLLLLKLLLRISVHANIATARLAYTNSTTFNANTANVRFG